MPPTELSACPFCGGAPVLLETMGHYAATRDDPAGVYSVWFTIVCDACGVEVSDEYRSSAIAAWNRRAPALSAAPAPPPQDSGHLTTATNEDRSGDAPDVVPGELFVIFDSQGPYEVRDSEKAAQRFCSKYNQRVNDPLQPYTFLRYVFPESPAATGRTGPDELKAPTLESAYAEGRADEAEGGEAVRVLRELVEARDAEPVIDDLADPRYAPWQIRYDAAWAAARALLSSLDGAAAPSDGEKA